MTTQQPKVKYTYADYCELPDDGRRYEIIDGGLYVAPAPETPHQGILLNLALLIAPVVKEGEIGRVLVAPCDVIFADGDVFQPDLIFVASHRLKIVTRRGVEAAPDLVVEVLSPFTRQRDLNLKRPRYAHYGVLEYWQADPETRTILTLALSGGEYVERGVYGVGDELTTPAAAGPVHPGGAGVREDLAVLTQVWNGKTKGPDLCRGLLGVLRH